MTDTTPIPPLINARDLLKAAHKLLSHERDIEVNVETVTELDGVLDDLTALLLKLKAVAHDGRWDL